MTDEDFKKLLVIDKLKLDEEDAQQAEWYFRVSEEAAAAGIELDVAKENLATVDATEDYLFRVQVEESKQKCTEKMVENHVKLSPAHVEAFRAYLNAKRIAAMWKGLERSFKQRNDRIGDLVMLYKSGYYQTVRRKNDSSEETMYQTKMSAYQSNRDKLAERLGKGDPS